MFVTKDKPLYKNMFIVARLEDYLQNKTEGLRNPSFCSLDFAVIYLVKYQKQTKLFATKDESRLTCLFLLATMI